MNILCVHDDDDQQAVVTYKAPKGVHLTKSVLDECAQKSVDQLNSQMDGGWRLANKSEFYNHLIQEQYGTSETFAIPGGDDWSNPELPNGQ